jgi:hypothetical protein
VAVFFLGRFGLAHQQALKFRTLSFYLLHNQLVLQADVNVQLLPKIFAKKEKSQKKVPTKF